jgi:hypothetical protein
MRLAPIVGGADDGKFLFELHCDSTDVHDYVRMSREEVVGLLVTTAKALGLRELVVPRDTVL